MNDNLLCNGLFGKTRQAVLALLYGRADSSFYTKQVLDAVKIGRGAVQRELKNLTDTGIITREVQGRQVYYRANEKCPIFNEFISIVRKTFGVADVIRQSLGTVADKIRVAFIFGSVAKRTENRFSDIDLLVVGNITFGEVVDLLSPAEATLNRELNPVVYTLAEFNRRLSENHYFISDILSGDKIFVVGDENELQSLVGKGLVKGT